MLLVAAVSATAAPVKEAAPVNNVNVFQALQNMKNLTTLAKAVKVRDRARVGLVLPV